MKRYFAFQLSAKNFFLLLAIALIAYLTVVPLVMLLYGSLKSSPPGLPGHFTLDNYAALFPI